MKFAESLRKNKDEIKGIIKHAYPDFVFKEINELEKGDIPVFHFHDLNAEKFEEQLKYLYENHYKTIDASTLMHILIGDIKPIDKAVVLTFDDGLRSIWEVAFPLLEKYGFKGVSFIIPGLINNQGSDTSFSEIPSLCTWPEIVEMHKSGFLDFQSHSLNHGTVFISDKVVDFINPLFKPNFAFNSYNPLSSKDLNIKLREDIKWGLPIYESDSNLLAEKNYIQNEIVDKTCTKFVEDNGGEDFFKRKGWRKKLVKIYKSTKSKFEEEQLYRSKKDRLDEIVNDLSLSKKEIELKLGKNVEHLCFPWYKASSDTVNLAKEIGYRSCYWGIVENESINKVGGNPFYIKRINSNYIFSLPGKKRKSMFKILREKWLG